MSWLTTTTLLLAAVVLLSGGTGVAAEREIWEDIKDMDIFRIKDGSYACPLPVMGERCPNSNWLFYFKCCGDLNLNCCFRMQDWAVTLIAFFIILIIISALCNILRCIFCFN